MTKVLRQGWVGLLVAGFACGDPAEPVVETPTVVADYEGASIGNWSWNNPTSLSFGLRLDTNAPNRYFFSFRIADGDGSNIGFVLPEALEVASLTAWGYTQPVFSSDGGQTWQRVTNTGMSGPSFTFSTPVGSDTTWFALKIPYDFSKWLAFRDELSQEPLVTSIEEIGQSLDARPVHLLTVTDDTVPVATKNAIWVVARQHPGEPGSSYMVEGFLRWLIGGSTQAAELLRQAQVFVVPFMNPDGVAVGNQRVNFAGLDLNRQWMNPDPSTAPTVAATLNRIETYRDAGGVTSILIDFHSAPTARSNFFFYNEAASSSQALYDEIRDVITLAHQINPDFIELAGSVARPVDQGQRGRSWGYYALGTHGLTVESSGNDVTYGPNAGAQQTVDRLLALGRAVGQAVAERLYGIPR